MSHNKDIIALLKAEWEVEPSADVMLAAQDIAGDFKDTVVGIFFYGSCLRTGKVEGNILDFYVIVDSYADAYDRKWLAVANWLCPPNVFYKELEIDDGIVRSKYTIISHADFLRRCHKGALNSSIWARFCQPVVLLTARDGASEESLLQGCCAAINTAVEAVLPLYSYIPSSMEVWESVFKHTYSAEFRSERRQKALEIYISSQQRFDSLAEMVYASLGHDPNKKIDHQPPRMPIFKANAHWWLRRLNGKTASILRLMKASVTFKGGIDYLAWKIKRHSGIEMEVKPWMRKYPLFAGLIYFWRMKSRDAFR